MRVDSAEIAEAIRKMKPKFSSGADGIASFIIKGYSELFVLILEHIFNLPLSSKTFPSLWKRLVVVPVLKNGEASLVINYRPISLLRGFSKVFELVICTKNAFLFPTENNLVAAWFCEW